MTWVKFLAYLSIAVINTTEIIFNKLTELGEIILHPEWLMLKKSLEKTASFILHKAKLVEMEDSHGSAIRSNKHCKEALLGGVPMSPV